MIYEYTGAAIFFFVSFVLTIVIVSLGDLFIEPTYDVNKVLPYECGFQPFDLDIQQFDIRYYLVALLFLIFDVEIAFLVPYINVYSSINIYVYLNFMFFILALLIGFIYEWKNKFLDWE